HNDGQCSILALDRLQKLQAVHAGKFEVGQNQIDGILTQKFEAGLGIFGGEGGEAVVAEIQLEQAAHLGLVLDNQNRRHGRVILDSLSSSSTRSFMRSPSEPSLPPQPWHWRRGKISQNGR